VDQPPLSPTDFASAVTAITSAFGDTTRREIYLWVRERDGVTASDVAAAFDLHSNVARHHLDKLANGGYVDVGRSASGGAGRPSKRYTASQQEMPLGFAVRHDALLVSLLGRSLAALPSETAQAIAEEVGVEYGEHLAASLGVESAQQSFRSALHTVADALSAHGFAAHTEHHLTDLRIVSEHCPFGTAPIDYPVICAVDRGLVKGMLGALYGETEPATSSSRPMGDDHCVTEVQATV
jgi:predicted ArsR family transcriptional regulator